MSFAFSIQKYSALSIQDSALRKNMANKDYDSRYDRGIARERVHANNSWRTYDGDSPQDREGQRRAWSGANIGTRHERTQGPGRFGRSRSTQDFENENARRYNRGREGDQEWRLSDYDAEDYTADHPAHEYGERRGFSAYGRARYDPDINRDWEDPLDRERMERSDAMRRSRTNTNGWALNGSEHDNEHDDEPVVPYASHKNGQRAHGRTERHEYRGGARSYGDRGAMRQPTTQRRSRTSSIMVPVLVLGGFAVLAGVMQAVVPRVVDAIGGIFSRD
jgi:hypothetical protein